jgi:membrane associated rhomboid family serine protease
MKTIKTAEYMLVGTGAVVLVGTIIWGSVLISSGMLLGLMTLAGFVILYKRIPLLKKFATRYPAVFDISAAAITYFMFGSTIIGLLAAAVVGLGTSILLDFEMKRTKRESCVEMDDFASALGAA